MKGKRTSIKLIFLFSSLFLNSAIHAGFLARDTSAMPPYYSEVNNELPFCTADNTPVCKQRINIKTIPDPLWRPIITLGGGMIFTAQVGEPKTFPVTDSNTNTIYIYNSDKPTQTGAVFNIFLATEFILPSDNFFQIGFNFTQSYVNYRAKGQFFQGPNLVSLNQYNYRYHVTARQFLLEGKLLSTFNHVFHPYFSIGGGLGLNNVYDYNHDVLPSLTFTREYKNKMTECLSYAVGAGLDMDIRENIRLGLGYRFTNFGKINLGKATIDNTIVSGTLSQSHVYSNIILAELTFIF